MLSWLGLVRRFSNHQYNDQKPATPILSSKQDLQVVGLQDQAMSPSLFYVVYRIPPIESWV